MPEFGSPQEEAAYWRGRYDEATDALQHERARIERFLLAAVKWVEPSQIAERDG
jgi:hypothetical protein